MGCDFINEGIGQSNGASKFHTLGTKKDGLDLYLYDNPYKIFFESDAFICPLCKDKFPENEVQEIKSLKRKDVDSFRYFICTSSGNETPSDCEEKVAEYEKMLKEEENYLKTLFYKHKCIKNNQEIYLWLYTGYGLQFRSYVSKDRNLTLCLRDLKYKIHRNNRNNRNNDNNDDGKITKNGYFRGIKLCGKVQVVDSFPDFKVQVVDSFPDLKVKVVDSFPDEIGKWQFVDSFPDFKIQFVDSFPDFKIQYVDSFPGVN